MASMSSEMVKAYIMGKLAKAVSGGTIHGTTMPAPDGHTHEFTVMYDEHEKMFIGHTSIAGMMGHMHHILVSVYDIINPTVEPLSSTEEAITAIMDVANAPANMRKILAFYNLSEIRLNTHHHDEHSHVLVLRFAGHNIDKMGRKTEASPFSKGLEEAQKEDARLADIKQNIADADKYIEKIIKDASKNSKK